MMLIMGSEHVNLVCQRQVLYCLYTMGHVRLAMQGSILSGRLRWSFNIVRNCEMFWFGVTANISRDPASFIAVDPSTWMVSDEAFALEHCRRALPNFIAHLARGHCCSDLPLH
jgi:hypothetical protein